MKPISVTSTNIAAKICCQLLLHNSTEQWLPRWQRINKPKGKTFRAEPDDYNEHKE